MRFAFATCVELGLACIEEIYSIGGKLDLVLTLKDDLVQKKSGRVLVDEFCDRNNIDLLKIANINEEEAVQAVHEHNIDWLFIIGWSQIARTKILQSPSRGVLGMHPTLLPVGRGRAPIPWAILKGLSETGVTLFQLDEGVDTGPILAQERLHVAPDESATSLYSRIAELHRVLIRNNWLDLVQNKILPVPQDSSKATVWPARKPEDGRITNLMSVDEVDRLVRATTHPYPGAFWSKDGQIIRIWCGKVSNPVEPQPPGALRLQFRDGVFDALVYVVE